MLRDEQICFRKRKQCLIFLFSLFILVTGKAPSSLRMVHIYFRHGERTPLYNYPKDPYQADYWQEGSGQLTNEGKLNGFNLGKYFRNRYAGFLNESYGVNEVYSRSSDNDRRLVAAECVLAGLYPPAGHQFWNPLIEWQPIPVHTTPLPYDALLSTAESNCPYYQVLVKKLKMTEVREIDEKNHYFLDFIQKKTGLREVSVFNSSWLLFDTLLAERLYGLDLPLWVNETVFRRLNELADISLTLRVKGPEKSRFNAGVLLKEMVDHMILKTEKPHDSSLKKLYLYSGHDIGLAAFLDSLQLYNDTIPPFSSSIIIELHEIQNQCYVKLLYKPTITEEPIVLTLPHCRQICLLQDFIDLTSKMMITRDEWQTQCFTEPETISNEAIHKSKVYDI